MCSTLSEIWWRFLLFMKTMQSYLRERVVINFLHTFALNIRYRGTYHLWSRIAASPLCTYWLSVLGGGGYWFKLKDFSRLLLSYQQHALSSLLTFSLLLIRCPPRPYGGKNS